ncbi:MAG: hypothetical protein ACTHKX_00705 [Pseudolysinimonas sp.]
MNAPSLTAEEIAFIRAGLGQWGGPVGPDDSFARRFGFDDAVAFRAHAARVSEALSRDGGAAEVDWSTVLTLTDIMVTDDELGAGWEWTIVTPYNADESTALLASIRGKLT